MKKGAFQAKGSKFWRPWGQIFKKCLGGERFGFVQKESFEKRDLRHQAVGGRCDPDDGK